ncbi:uncharacterized protein LOC115633821 [Scaptodrosophila lebanonensis]|uniref:Uncharacterized protein LOC115633821 n=1 Tax=Drosophila lebanonensis TaxID=7225 RepID=A0A6J2UIX2_DROLE|nr:uncharacterized protein LOC115633821 [Scaptodrosophila lebanonensis]
MAELLSREKELFKLNQELNFMADNPLEASATYPMVKTGGGSVDKTATIVLQEPRYGTFHKQKGPSTLLKRKGVGETQGGKPNTTDPVADRTFMRWTQKQRATLPTRLTASPTKKMATTAGRPVSTSVLANSGNAAPAPLPVTKTKILSSNGANPTAQNESKYSTYTRGQVSKTATYVKFRNPKFTESRSLEDIIRNADESQVVEVEITQQRESTTVVNGNAKKQLTQDNFIKFLKAKVAILEEDHARISQSMAEHKERLEQAVEAQRRADSQRDHALNSNKQLSEQLRRAEQQTEDANRRHKEGQIESSNQQREFEQIKREVRLLKQTNTNLENRLASAQEEMEGLRQTMSKLRGEQREEKEKTRNELDIKEKRIKALKRQRADLLNAYKKQLYLIDNLKRQTTCLEQSVGIGFGEKEFNKVLDWNTKA